VGIWKYFEDREREIRSCSMHVGEDDDSLFWAEEDERRGRIYGRILFDGYPESVYMLIHEDVVERETGGFTRPRYAYFLVIDGHEIGGYERHDTHRPPVHKHCSGNRRHERSPCSVMSFRAAVTDAWKYVAEFATPDPATSTG
jgi:hypothetical protein